MPIYDYICNACGQEHEISHSFSEPNRKECPACKENELKKVVTAPSGIVFNGAGFYETDYKRKAKSESEGSNIVTKPTESSGGSCKHKAACACA